MSSRIQFVATKPFNDQKLGTSGLRKKVSVFSQACYVENLIQSYFTTYTQMIKGSKLEHSSFFICGDGRYMMKECIETIVKVALGNKVRKLIIAHNGICSTPAASYMITRLRCDGGIILTASHNPGGPNADFGIKFNQRNGGPEKESFTDQIFKIASSITSFCIVDTVDIDISKLGVKRVAICREDECSLANIEVVDVIGPYSQFMREVVFDERWLKLFTARGLRLTANALHGVMGPFVNEILVKQLGVEASGATRCNTLEDFGGLHPDPNLIYAAELMDVMERGYYDLGVAFDGDGDRNMIIGKNGFFVSPCDSVAIIAAHYEYIPFFKCVKTDGLARSMPTSAALDRVAEKLGLKCYETPTGWKYFGNLLEAGKIFICGEESFGTSSSHIREKDGMWALLAWMSIIALRNMSVEEIVKDHWRKYGRNYYTRYDYENCDIESSKTMMEHLETLCQLESLPGKTFNKDTVEFTVKKIDNFRYVDPIDGSVADKQGIRVIFTDGSRIIFRLSGTGSSGATVRMYIEYYESNPDKILEDPAVKLKPLIEVALEISQLVTFTGRTEPTVIT